MTSIPPINRFQLVTLEQVEPLLHQLAAIRNDLQELKRLSFGSREEDVLLTTKEAMALLKFQHLNTFKKYLRDNKVNPVSLHKPLRYKKSELLKSK
jgi:hypothetical protein